MKTYKLIKMVPAKSLEAAIKLEKNFPVESAYQELDAPTGQTTAIGFRIANDYDDE